MDIILRIVPFFRNGYGLDQLREGLLLKAAIDHLLGAGKPPRKNNFQKIVRFTFQMIVIRLPLKRPLGMGIWSKYGKELELAVKIDLTKCFLMTSSTWIINVYIHLHRRNSF